MCPVYTTERGKWRNWVCSKISTHTACNEPVTMTVALVLLVIFITPKGWALCPLVVYFLHVHVHVYVSQFITCTCTCMSLTIVTCTCTQCTCLFVALRVLFVWVAFLLFLLAHKLVYYTHVSIYMYTMCIYAASCLCSLYDSALVCKMYGVVARVTSLATIVHTASLSR